MSHVNQELIVGSCQKSSGKFSMAYQSQTFRMSSYFDPSVKWTCMIASKWLRFLHRGILSILTSTRCCVSALATSIRLLHLQFIHALDILTPKKFDVLLDLGQNVIPTKATIVSVQPIKACCTVRVSIPHQTECVLWHSVNVMCITLSFKSD